MPWLQPQAPEPQTAAWNLAILLPLLLTMAPNPPLASQVGPRREAAAGGAREDHQISRYRCLTTTGRFFSVRRSMLGCRSVEKPNLHVGQCASLDYCAGEWLTMYLHTGAQAWIGWSPGAALPPTRAAPWTRALLLLPTGRPSGLGLIDKSFVPLSHPLPTSLMESHLSV